MTSCGTESNNIAVSGTALENEYKGNHIITSSQEHHAILHIMEYLISRGFHVTYLPVDESGLINIDDLKRTLTRSEEHTSELQSRGQLVCRLLLEKKK